MFFPGKTQKLYINRFAPQGAYLAVEKGEEEEVLLPTRYLLETMEEGSEVEVFVYYDSEDRLVATTDMPFAKAGEVAQMEVVDKNSFGYFLDWGLPKDLFLPFANLTYRPYVGDWCVVAVYQDERSGRMAATMKLNHFVNNTDLSDIEEGEEVGIVLAEHNERGFRCVINNRHWGMLYSNQIFKEVFVGDILRAHVVKITEDNRIDLSLTATGYKQAEESAVEILRLLERNDGVLLLGDKSSPEEIYEVSGMSKKMFKRGIGNLLREGKITAEEKKILLL